MDFLGKLLIIIVFVVLMLGIYIVISGKGSNMLDAIKNFMRFGVGG